jgi:beta-hydroxyacyl-ACP dehydratase FabZ
LPHRYPFLLVDRIQEIVQNEYAIGLKNVTLNEPFFQGHFPHYRVMPGVLVIEAMAQVGGVLVYYSNTVTLGKTPLFTGIDRGKFRRQVTPGDQLVMRLEVMRRRGPVWRMRGQAFVEQALAAEAELQVYLADNTREGQKR